jgi:cell division protein ZapA (FtsZ GTPase activity inhibitor)
MANELCLDILGTSFTITADEDEAYLQEILNQYRAAVESTQSISGINDNLNVAILTGFLLCDEINKMKLKIKLEGEEKEASSGEAREVEERTLKLIAKLDQALKNCGNG